MGPAHWLGRAPGSSAATVLRRARGRTPRTQSNKPRSTAAGAWFGDECRDVALCLKKSFSSHTLALVAAAGEHREAARPGCKSRPKFDLNQNNRKSPGSYSKFGSHLDPNCERCCFNQRMRRTMSEAETRCVLLADPHHGMSEGMRGLLATAFEAVVMVADEVSLFESAGRLDSHLAIVDLALSRGNVLEMMRRLRSRFPAMKVIAVSVHDQPS